MFKNLPVAIFTQTPTVPQVVQDLVKKTTQVKIFPFSHSVDLSNINLPEETKMIWWIDREKDIIKQKAKEFVKLLQTRSILSAVIMQQPFTGSPVGEELHQVVRFLEQASPYTSIFMYRGVWQKDFLAFPQQMTGTPFEEIVKTAFKLADTPRGGKRKVLVDERVDALGVEFLDEFSQKVVLHSSTIPLKNSDLLSISRVGESKDPVKELPTPRQIPPLPKPIELDKQPQKNDQPLDVHPVVEPEKEEREEEKLTVKTKRFFSTKAIVIPQLFRPEIQRSSVVLHQIPENPVIKTPWQEVGVGQEKKVARQPVKVIYNTQDFERKFTNLFHQTVQPVEVDKDQLDSKIRSLHQPKLLRKKIADKVKKRKKVFSLFMVLVMLVSAGVSGYLGSYFWVKSNVIFFAEHLEVEPQPSFREKSFQVATQVLDKYQLAFNPLLTEEQQSDHQKLISASRALSDFFITHRKITTLLHQTVQRVMSYQDGEVFTDLEKFPALAEDSYKKLATVESIVKNPEYEDLLFGEQREKSVEQLTLLRKNLRLQQEIVQILPDLLGKDSKKIYAVFLQDIQESRPSGGKLVSLALVTFENGKFINYQIVPLSSFDEVDEIILPPQDLQQHLQVDNWSLSDGNWDVDFSVAGEHLIWHLEKGLSQSIDGVMTVHSGSFKNLIGAIGGISIPSSGEVIDGKNFLEKIRFYTFQKKTNPEEDFTNFLENFLAELKKEQNDNIGQVISQLYLELSEHEVQLKFKDPDLQLFGSMLGWSGEILSPNCPSQIVQAACLVSTFFETHTNIAKNKVSADLSREASYTIQFRPHSIYYNYDFSYKTISKDINFPGGVAQELVRIYVPKNVENIEVEIQGRVLTEEEYTILDKNGRKEIAYVLNIPPESTITGKVQYSQPSVELPFSYSFFVQKQPGEVASPTTITYSYDLPFLPSVVAPEASVLDKSTVFKFEGKDHMFTGIKFRNIEE